MMEPAPSPPPAGPTAWISALRQRRVPQFFGVYLAGGWIVLQLIDQLVANSILTQSAYRVTLVTYVIGLPAVAVLAWFHGNPGKQRFGRVEAVVLATIFSLWFVVAGLVVRSGSTRAAQPFPSGAAPTVAAPANIGGSFLIAPFRNLSGSSDHDWLIEGSPSLLADLLGQWREISVVPPERMQAVLRREHQKPGDALDIDVLLKMASETGARSVVAGEVVRAGEQLRIVARAYDAPSGVLVIDAKEVLGPNEDVRNAYDRLAARLLRAAGLTDINVDFRSVTTESLEAYKAYATGVAHLHRGERRRAERAFKTAIQLDSTFAQAWAQLASVSMYTLDDILDRRSKMYVYAARAAELSARLPERQRHYIQAINAFLQGQFASARREIDAVIANDSTDVDALAMLVDIELTDPILVSGRSGERPRGSYNRAVQLAEKVLRLEPRRHSAYRVLAMLYTRLADPRPGRTMPPAALVPGYRKELESLPALFESMPVRMFRAIQRDTIVLIPQESTAQISQDTLAAAQKRAHAKARAWIDRWLAVAPGEAAAHMAASRLAELEHDVTAAAAAQHAAEALAPVEEQNELPIRRVALLGTQRRYAEARSLSDSLVRAGFFDNVSLSTLSTDYGWAFAIYLMHADATGVDALFRAFGKAVQPVVPSLIAQGLLPTPKNEAEKAEVTEMMVTALLCSSKDGDMKQGQVASPAAAPPAVLLEALDSLARNAAKIPRGSSIMRRLPDIFAHAAFSADAASARRSAGRMVDLAIALAADANTIEVARRLARNAVIVDTSLRSRLVGSSWFQ